MAKTTFAEYYHSVCSILRGTHSWNAPRQMLAMEGREQLLQHLYDCYVGRTLAEQAADEINTLEEGGKLS